MANVSIDARKDRDGNSPISRTQRQRIQEARNDAFRIVRRALNDLHDIWDQSGSRRSRRKKRRKAWLANRKVVRWFGKGDVTDFQIRWTRKRLIRIKGEFEGTLKFTIIQHQTGRRSWLCDSNTLAYCSPGTPIKLCPTWFRQSRKRRAMTVVHELSHKNGHIHHRGAKDPSSARKLAREHPRLARRNPENFEQFCGEYY